MQSHCLSIRGVRSTAAGHGTHCGQLKSSFPVLNVTAAAGTGLMLCIVACLSLVGCREPYGPSSGSTKPDSVTISAAASTQDAINEIAALFEDRTGVTVLVNSASSSALATQIISGAPADLFLSANVKWADAVQEQISTAARRLLLNNRLVMIVPRGNPQHVTSPEALKQERVARIALAGEEVPAGIYARQALQRLGINEAVQKDQKIVTGHNVRIALSYVDRAEADAGIVYATDAKISDGVETVYTFDAQAHDPIEYPLVLLTNKQDNPAALQLFEFLASEEAAAIFERYGFTFAKNAR